MVTVNDCVLVVRIGFVVRKAQSEVSVLVNILNFKMVIFTTISHLGMDY